MKHIYLLTISLISSLSFADGQDSKLSLIKNLMEVDGTYQRIELIKKRTMEDIKTQVGPNKERQDYYNELDKQLDESHLAAAFQNSLADIYTEEEVKTIIKMVSSPESKALFAKSLKYSESTSVIIREWLQSAQERAVMATLK